MQEQKSNKLFAFKLAQKKAAPAPAAGQWKARMEPAAAAGCTGPQERGSGRLGRDTGMVC